MPWVHQKRLEMSTAEFGACRFQIARQNFEIFPLWLWHHFLAVSYEPNQRFWRWQSLLNTTMASKNGRRKPKNFTEIVGKMSCRSSCGASHSAHSKCTSSKWLFQMTFLDRVYPQLEVVFTHKERRLLHLSIRPYHDPWKQLVLNIRRVWTPIWHAFRWFCNVNLGDSCCLPIVALVATFKAEIVNTFRQISMFSLGRDAQFFTCFRQVSWDMEECVVACVFQSHYWISVYAFAVAAINNIRCLLLGPLFPATIICNSRELIITPMYPVARR
jgi:hypothetical protein